MGGGDLNTKKSWHPNTMKNQERVWKAEQAQAHEKQRIDDLRREMDNERTREELTSHGQTSGVLAGNTNKKMDWMYQQPNESVDREQYLLGKAVDKTFEKMAAEEQARQSYVRAPPKNHVEHECIPFSIRNLSGHTGPAETQVDMARKLLEDPLVAIRKRELESRAQLLQNPVKLKELTMLLKADQDHSKQKKRKKKSKNKDSDLDTKLAEKLNRLKKSKDVDVSISELLSSKHSKSKSHKKKKKRKHHSSSESDSESEREKESRKRKHEKQSRTDGERLCADKRKTYDGDRSPNQDHHSNSNVKNKNFDSSQYKNSTSKRDLKSRDSYQNERETRDNYYEKGKESRHNPKKLESRNNYERDSKDYNKREKESQEKESRTYYKAEKDSKEYYSKEKHLRNYDQKEKKTEDKELRNNYEGEKKSRDYYPKEKDSKNYNKKERDSGEKESRNNKKREKDLREDRDSEESDQEEPKRKIYGLVKADGTKIQLSHKHAEPVQTPNTEVVKKWEKPKREKLNEEEKEARRREMMEDATKRDIQRVKNVAYHRAQEKKIEEKNKSVGYKDDFVEEQLRKVARHETVESRIKSNIYNIQRSRNDADSSFVKR